MSSSDGGRNGFVFFSFERPFFELLELLFFCPPLSDEKGFVLLLSAPSLPSTTVPSPEGGGFGPEPPPGGRGLLFFFPLLLISGTNVRNHNVCPVRWWV